jgi:predicted amidophosphoribosyltransferase
MSQVPDCRNCGKPNYTTGDYCDACQAALDRAEEEEHSWEEP